MPVAYGEMTEDGKLAVTEMALGRVKLEFGRTKNTKNCAETLQVCFEGRRKHNNIIQVAQTSVPFKPMKKSVHHSFECC